MVIQCPKCKKQYNVDGEKITESGVKITCPACRHQFIVKKKQEEAPEEDKKPKSPPCAVCGQPSTHVFVGPPPRPLCEYHYTVEKEKQSRFFESKADANDKTAPPVKPAAAPAQPAITGPPSEPAFESFDDDFDFFDSEEASDGAPAQSAGVAKPGGDPSFSQVFPDNAGSPGKTQALGPSGQDPFLPDPMEAADTNSADTARAASLPDPFQPGDLPPKSPSPEPDPFSAAAMGEAKKQEDPFSANGSISSDGDSDPFRPSPEDSMGPIDSDDFTGFEKEDAPASKIKSLKDYNLDGSPVDESYSELEEQESSFEWETPSESTGSKPLGVTLDAELGAPLRSESQTMQDPAPVSAPPKKQGNGTMTWKPVKQRGLTETFSLLSLLLLLVAGSLYVSFSNPGPASSAGVSDYSTPSRTWAGKLSQADDDELPSVTIAPLEPLSPVSGPGDAGVAVEASKLAEEALGLMLEDTSTSYEQALARVEKAIAIDPRNSSNKALKIEILAFRETLDKDGGTTLKADESKDELEALGKTLANDPALLRAKAHVFLNFKTTIAARKLLEDYEGANPRDAIASYLIGMTYLHQPSPDLESAEKFLKKAVETEPDLIRAYWELAGIYRRTGRQDEAINMYTEVLTRSPKRAGTAKAMEETEREKSGPPPATKPEKPGEEIVIDVKPAKPEKKSKGIKGTGEAITEVLLDSIIEVEPQLRRIKPLSTSPTSGTPIKKTLPPPPEEAPR